jgi:hypothetical protein
MQFQVTISMNYQAFTYGISISYAEDHEQASSLFSFVYYAIL